MQRAFPGVASFLGLITGSNLKTDNTCKKTVPYFCYRIKAEAFFSFEKLKK